ncbi:MAG: dTMP kinase [Gammaproteobacteria bacterium]|nr:MAG: dTMP kinase [Gammaproteobacteria bacterium]
MSSAFVTLEGLEGVGKSTNLAYLEQLLVAAGEKVVVTREPGGTPLGEQIRQWVLMGDHAGLPAEVETLLMFAARAQHLNEVIRPALADGAWVLCDRFTDATFAYQGGGRGATIDLLEQLKRAIQRDLEPDLTLLFDAPVEVGFERIANRAHDHFEREDHSFFDKVRTTYLELAERYPERIKRIDATQSLETVQQELSGHLSELLQRTTTDG